MSGAVGALFFAALARGMAKIRTTWERAKELLEHGNQHPGCMQLWADLYWVHQNPLNHEMLDMLEGAGWNPMDRNIRRMVYDVSAGPADTKRCLEDVFNHLRQVASYSKNHRLSKYRGFFEAAFAPVLRGGGAGLHQPGRAADADGLNQPAGSGEAARPAPTAPVGAHGVDKAPPAALPSIALSSADWEVPLLVPVSRMSEGMFRTDVTYPLPDCLDTDALKKAASPTGGGPPADAQTQQLVQFSSCHQHGMGLSATSPDTLCS